MAPSVPKIAPGDDNPYERVYQRKASESDGEESSAKTYQKDDDKRDSELNRNSKTLKVAVQASTVEPQLLQSTSSVQDFYHIFRFKARVIESRNFREMQTEGTQKSKSVDHFALTRTQLGKFRKFGIVDIRLDSSRLPESAQAILEVGSSIRTADLLSEHLNNGMFEIDFKPKNLDLWTLSLDPNLSKEVNADIRENLISVHLVIKYAEPKQPTGLNPALDAVGPENQNSLSTPIPSPLASPNVTRNPSRTKK